MLKGMPEACPDDALVIFLLASPTRSSLVGFCRANSVASVVAWHNGESDTPGLQETAVLRPWWVALAVVFENENSVGEAARQVASRNGFRARLKALRDLATEDNSLGQSTDFRIVGEVPQKELDLAEGLDALTYIPIKFSNPTGSDRIVSLPALVDTGYKDCSLHFKHIRELELRPAKRYGKQKLPATPTPESGLTFRANIAVQGGQALVRVTEVEEPSTPRKVKQEPGLEVEEDVDKVFGFGPITDEAILGFSALESLELVVDCLHHRLLPAVDIPPSYPWEKMSKDGIIYVEFSNPTPGSTRRIRSPAFVDTGSTDVEMPRSIIEDLGLEVDKEAGLAQYETSDGLTVEAYMYKVRVRIPKLGIEAIVHASPAIEEEEEEEEDKESDSDSYEEESSEEEEESLLGHNAIAALGLLVDCNARRLWLPKSNEEGAASGFAMVFR